MSEQQDRREKSSGNGLGLKRREANGDGGPGGSPLLPVIFIEIPD